MDGGHNHWSTGPRPSRTRACAIAHSAHSPRAPSGSPAAMSPRRSLMAPTTRASAGPSGSTATSPADNHSPRLSLAAGGDTSGSRGGASSASPALGAATSAAPADSAGPAARGGGGVQGDPRTVQMSAAISNRTERSGVTPHRPAVMAAARGWATLTHTGCVKRALTTSPGPLMVRAPPAATAATIRSPGCKVVTHVTRAEDSVSMTSIRCGVPATVPGSESSVRVAMTS